MAMFLITPINSPEIIAQEVKAQFPDDSFEIPKSNSLLVYFNGTGKELSDKLGISKGDSGTAVVVTVANYYGRAPVDIWEWMKNRMERD